MKKFDLILYNGEEILDLRLKLLYNHVDYFIISEFNRTFQNNKKPYYFDINQFKKFKKKIIYKKRKLPNNFKRGKSTWDIQAYQRDSLDKDVNIKDRDMIILSDVDEIIEPSKLRYKYNEIERYELLNLRFYGNYINLSSPWWRQPLSTSYNVAKDIGLQALRTSHKALKPGNAYNIFRQFLKQRKNNLIKNSGWHFSYMSSKKNNHETIKKKINSNSHYEHKDKVLINTNILNFRIKWGLDINQNSSPDLWGALNKKIIKNKKVFKWIKDNNLFYEREFNHIKANFDNRFPPSKLSIKLTIIINRIVYSIFFIQYILKKLFIFK